MPRLPVNPLAVALMIALLLTETSTVFTRKVPVMELTGMVIAGTAGFATAGLVLDSDTVIGEGPAAHSRVTVAVTGLGPRTTSGESASAATPIGRTDNVALLVTPA